MYKLEKRFFIQFYIFIPLKAQFNSLYSHPSFFSFFEKIRFCKQLRRFSVHPLLFEMFLRILIYTKKFKYKFALQLNSTNKFDMRAKHIIWKMLIAKIYLYNFSIINIHANSVSNILKRIFLLYRKVYAITMEVHFARKIFINIFLYFHAVECLRFDLNMQMDTFKKIVILSIPFQHTFKSD